MAELKRKDQELTTADLAGRSEKSREIESRPQLLRNERADAERAQSVDPRWRSNPTPGTDPAATRDLPAQQRPTSATTADQPTPLFQESEVGEFRSRWNSIQTAFVDEPRRAVEDADNLVASLMKKLAEGFANERSRLEGQWDRGDNVSTEDLRLALQRYRSFFDRLLKI
jgi:hypothetical protein